MSVTNTPSDSSRTRIPLDEKASLEEERLQLETEAARLNEKATQLEPRLQLARKRTAAPPGKSDEKAPARPPLPPSRSKRTAASRATPAPPIAVKKGAASPLPPALSRKAAPPPNAAPPKSPAPKDEAPTNEILASRDSGEHRFDEPEVGASSLMIILRGAPSWLVSAILHLVALIVLALITVALPAKDEDKVLLVADTAKTDELEVIDETVVEMPPLEIQEFTPQTVNIADPGAANMGVAPAFASVSKVAAVASPESTVSEIGALFGDVGKGMAKTGVESGGAEFFGVKASGTEFVFIVDSSKSMSGGKFEAACHELAYAVRRLSPKQRFYVMFFDRDCARMTLDPAKGPAPHAVPAVAGNIVRLERWMASIQLEVRTDPLECVKFGMKLLPDAIYLLTDGKFTDKGATIRYLKENNIIEDRVEGRYAKVVIHTVGFYRRDGEPTLMEIARDYNGTYRFVPQPGAAMRRKK